MITGDFQTLTGRLEELTRLAGTPGRLEELLTRALDALGSTIPHDLVALLELEAGVLQVRVARGPLADKRVLSHRLPLERHPTLRSVLETRRARVLEEHHHSGDEGDPYDGVLELPHGHSCMVIPVFAGERNLGVITFDSRTCGLYPPELVSMVTVYGQVIGLAMVTAELAGALDRHRRRLQEHNRLLEDEARGGEDAGESLARSHHPEMRRVVDAARQVAVTDAPVLLSGETGTGKEVLARALHGWSNRRDMPFVKVNCAALPAGLVESELFGHVKGAFSGAVRDRPGRFQLADGGTLLLDEVGDMPLEIQARLLRVLQEGTLQPVGSDHTMRVDVRVIAATHVDLEKAVEEGTFREDLYYRLSVFPLRLPPLRERREDLPQLAAHILEGIQRRTGRGPWHLSEESLRRMKAYEWPGNIRELVNVLERARILARGSELDVELPRVRNRPRAGAATEGSVEPPAGDKLPSLVENERAYLERLLAHTEGRVYGAGGAAELAGVPPTTLQSRLARLGLKRKAR
ncbi:sigma 54-interacting transcriptional regulator [Archangium minus]